MVTVVRKDLPLNVDAVTFIAGCTAEEMPDAVGFDQLGRITAAMHNHVRRLGGKQDYFTRFSWDADTMIGPDGRWGNWRHAPALTDADEAVIARAATTLPTPRLTEFGCTPDRFGLIHADLRMANLMNRPCRPVRSHHRHRVRHMRVVLASGRSRRSGVVHRGHPRGRGHDCRFGLRGTCESRELPAEHLDMIATFVMLRRLQLTAWVASHAHADSAIKFADGFAEGTARLADRYLGDRGWLRDAVHA